MRRGYSGRSRRMTVSAVKDPNLEAIASLSPFAMYVPRAEYVILNGSNVASLSDYRLFTDSNRDLNQGNSGFQPAYLATSGLPSGVPAIRGDGTDDRLERDIAGLPGAGNVNTQYLLARRRTGVVGQTAADLSGPTSGIGYQAGILGVRRSGYGNHGITRTIADGTTFWIEVKMNGSGVAPAFRDNLGNTAAGAALNNSPTITGIRFGGSVVLGNFTDMEIAAVIYFDSVLSTPDSTIVRNALSAYGGI